MKQTLKYIYGVIFENLKFVEGKHTIILTISSAVLAFATTFLEVNVYQNLFAIASIIFALIAIVYSFIALCAKKVKIKQKQINGKDNLVFYKHIMLYNETGYIEAIKKRYQFTNIYKPDNMDYDLAKEIITTSKLVWIKFLYFNFSIIYLVVSIICIIITVLIRGNIW